MRHREQPALSRVELTQAAGVGRNAWILAATPLSAALLHRSVLREERWLAARFGPHDDSYRSAAPRWL